jgi:GNAT superfamily N-acetyltransferase
MTQIKRITDRVQENHIRELESEYFTWVNTQLHAEFQITLNTEKMIANDLNNLEMYFPPHGGLFLAELDRTLVGMIFLAQLREGVGRIRRMYVRDAYRRRGIARALFETAIDQARDMEYSQLLLESPMSWSGAHALYHALGFEAVEMYPESEVPEQLRKYWVFMHLTL